MRALPRPLAGPYGAVLAALLAVVAWRVIASAVAMAQGASFESLIVGMVFLAVAGLALLPFAAAIALRPRLGWDSGRTHVAGLAAFGVLHLAVWAGDRGTILGDAGFFDRFMLALGGFGVVVALASHAHTLQAEGRLRLPERPVWAAGALLAAGLIVLATVLPAAAHVPAYRTGLGLPEDPVDVPGTGSSWAILQELEPGAVGVFARDLPRGERVVAQLVQLAVRGGEGFEPALAVVGPGLPPSTEPLPVATPPGDGALVVRGWERRGWEGFTEVPIRLGPEIAFPAPEGGRYLFLVWDPGGRGGEFWLALGHEEDVRPQDVHVFAAAYFETRARFW